MARSDRLGVINMEEPAKSRLSPHVHTNIFETTSFMWTEPFKSHPGKRYSQEAFSVTVAQSHYESLIIN